MPSEYAADIANIRDNVATLLERSDNTVKLLEKLNGRVNDLDDQVDDNCNDITALETRLGIWGGAQAGFTAIAAVLAGWWGSQR